jgi:hypothetical protein
MNTMLKDFVCMGSGVLLCLSCSTGEHTWSFLVSNFHRVLNVYAFFWVIHQHLYLLAYEDGMDGVSRNVKDVDQTALFKDSVRTAL